ncbi:MAG: hypothetical protein ACRBFS_02200 [Aureispira sp.]
MATVTTRFSWLSWLAPFLVAMLCWMLWYLEWSQMVPQEGLAWTQHNWQCIYPIIFLTILVFLWPLHQAFEMPLGWGLFYMALLCVGSWLTYWGARSIFQALYLEGLLVGDTNLAAWSLWELLGMALGLALCYFLPLWHYHQTTDGMHVLTLLEAFILVVPCSLITLELFPMGSAELSFINAVKLGYPVFWTPIGLGYLSRAIAEEWL